MLLVGLACLAACQRTADENPGPPAHVVEVPGEDAQHQRPSMDVQGILVTFRDDGTIQIRGRDRWGNGIETSYENAQFFRQALPVLERSLTPGQVQGLQALMSPSPSLSK